MLCTRGPNASMSRSIFLMNESVTLVFHYVLNALAIDLKLGLVEVLFRSRLSNHGICSERAGKAWPSQIILWNKTMTLPFFSTSIPVTVFHLIFIWLFLPLIKIDSRHKHLCIIISLQKNLSYYFSLFYYCICLEQKERHLGRHNVISFHTRNTFNFPTPRV